jgi:hypothetical protein
MHASLQLFEYAHAMQELKHQGAVRIQTANSVIVRNNYFLENKAPNVSTARLACWLTNSHQDSM